MKKEVIIHYILLQNAHYKEEKNHAWSPCIIRYSEVLLNKAEALCKLDRNSEAITILNSIRANRDCPDYNNDVISGRGYTDLLDILLEERRIELAYEGHRALDLFRNKRILIGIIQEVI